MKLRCTATVWMALLAASLLVAAMSGTAQATPNSASGGAAGPIAHGHAEYVGQSGIVLSLTFNLVELPDGSVTGRGRHGVIGTGFVLFELTSFMFVDDSLAMAGEITQVVGDVPPFLAVGTTIFFFVNDNDPDRDEVQMGVIPAEDGNPTIQEIFEDFGPPPFYQTIISGDIVIF